MWTHLDFSEINFLVHEQKESLFFSMPDENQRSAFL